jgi:hypothetical protein
MPTGVSRMRRTSSPIDGVAQQGRRGVPRVMRRSGVGRRSVGPASSPQFRVCAIAPLYYTRRQCTRVGAGARGRVERQARRCRASAGAACAAGGCDGGLSHRRTGRLHRRYGSRHCATIATAGDPTRSSPPNARRPTCAPTSRAAGRGRCGPSCAALCAGAAPRDAASRAPLLYNRQPAGRELVALTVGN